MILDRHFLPYRCRRLYLVPEWRPRANNFTGSYGWAENIAWMSTRSPAGLQNEVEQLHTNLMNSSGHRANLLNANYREIGVGLEVGQYGTYEGAFVTQNFARSGSNSFVTGVAIGDADGDKRYDIGEGLGGIAVSAKNNATNAVTTTSTNGAGGFELSLASGNYTINFSGSGITTSTKQVSLGSKNIKLDLINPSSGAGTPTAVDEPNSANDANHSNNANRSNHPDRPSHSSNPDPP